MFVIHTYSMNRIGPFVPSGSYISLGLKNYPPYSTRDINQGGG